MTITPLVKAWAEHFNCDAALVQAVITAEGDILRAVQCTYPNITSESDAIRITCRTIVHRQSEFAKLHTDEFVAFLGATWAPVGAANDPHGLNANWVPNVTRLWNAESKA